MANEIQIQASMQVANGAFIDSFKPNGLSVTQALAGEGGGIQSIPTSDTVVSLGSVTTNGWCFLQNLNSTNFIEYGPASGGAIVKLGRLKAGEFAVFRLTPGAILRAISDTGACLLFTKLLND